MPGTAGAPRPVSVPRQIDRSSPAIAAGISLITRFLESEAEIVQGNIGVAFKVKVIFPELISAILGV